jgi:DNA-binding transcriptional regulator YhcF (GntR family)
MEQRRVVTMPTVREHKALKIEVYEIVWDYVAKHTYVPSAREISEQTGACMNTVRRCLHELIDDGLLESDVRDGETSRAYRMAGTKVVKKR